MSLGLLVVLLALGTPEDSTWSGRLSVVGHEPFTALVLTDAQGLQWRLQGDAVPRLWKEGQGRLVRITGTRIAGQAPSRNAILVRSWVWLSDDEEKP